jgi:glycosyltransferase involved in cell wall biosynthesis
VTPRLSICIATRNMAHVLPLVLRNVSDIADEIVVVDNHSTDGTPELVRSHARTRLIQHEFPGSFAANKNLAIEAASGDWVLVVDSDELLGDRLRREMPELIADRSVDYYKLARYWLVPGPTRRYVVSGKHYPDWQLRLFRNRTLFRYPADQLIHHHFPRENRGRGRKLRGRHLFHLDFLLNDRARRERKVAERNRMDPLSKGVNEAFYLYEGGRHVLRRCREPLSNVDIQALAHSEADA